MTGLRYVIYFVVTVLMTTAIVQMVPQPTITNAGESSMIEMGRHVYISEGCIHCHSQYVRPVGQDGMLWGQATTVEQAMGQSPVLIGNRRQGPDLANVSLRRNAGWNQLHLIEPSAVVPGSRMPSYRHLFANGGRAGAALLEYLDSLKPLSISTDNSTETPTLHP